MMSLKHRDVNAVALHPTVTKPVNTHSILSYVKISVVASVSDISTPLSV